jgi:hypothetical protein
VREEMYFGQSGHSDSSDDSPLYPRNVTIKLKDLGTTNHTKDEKNNENNQYVNSSSYHDLTTAIEKEKTKSILSRGNTKTRRKAPPPPTPPTPEQQSHRVETKVSIQRKTAMQMEPNPRRLLERVDYSPLTSPENIKFAR